MTRARILILGGSKEGFDLAEQLYKREDLEITSSLAGRTPAPRVPVGPVRRGGFGGVGGLSTYLQENKIDAVIDATHPFANIISQNAHAACRFTGTPCVHLWRAPWTPVEGDRWVDAENVAKAADNIPYGAQGVFLTTGKTELCQFAHRDDVGFIARIVAPLSEEEQNQPLPRQLAFIYERGPFHFDGELALLKSHRVSQIITKNSGGDAAFAKLKAARYLAIPVTMIKRPAAPSGKLVAGAGEALAWLEENLNKTKETI